MSATWNPSDKNAGITLSGGNLIATRTSGTNGSGRATNGLSAGLVYAEFTITAVGNDPQVGFANSSALLADWLGQDANGWGYDTNGQFYNNGANVSTPGAYTTGDVLGLAINFTTGKAWWRKNGTWNGDPVAGTGQAVSGLTGTLYLAWGFFSGTSESITLNTGGSSFAGSIPSGYAAWGPLGNVFRQGPLDGIGGGGPFFSDPLAG